MERDCAGVRVCRVTLARHGSLRTPDLGQEPSGRAASRIKRVHAKSTVSATEATQSRGQPLGLTLEAGAVRTGQCDRGPQPTALESEPQAPPGQHLPGVPDGWQL